MVPSIWGVLVSQSCLILCDPMDCSPPGSSVHGILQAKIVEWVAIPFSRVSSQPRNRTQVSNIAASLFYHLSHQRSPKQICLYMYLSSTQSIWVVFFYAFQNKWQISFLNSSLNSQIASSCNPSKQDIL